MYTTILVRFGELNTKGKNKKTFIQKLFTNIKRALKNYPTLEYIKAHDRIYIELHDENYEAVCESLSIVSGIQNFSVAVRVEKDKDAIINKAFELANNCKGKTFKVKVKRADKNFPIHSDDMVRLIASKILRETEFKVNVHEPDFYIHADIRLEGAFVFSEVIPGAGGFPLGVGGKALLLMSGGIDSPVAAHLLMKRGVEVEAIHFASPPYTSDGAIQKVKDLLNVLAKVQGKIKLTIIPFTKLQEEIYKNEDDSYHITIMRRMMYRIAEKVANHDNCLALASGESIGQVASQTLESMATINEVVKIPMIRPLAISDKLDIIAIAKKIGTYEISIRPFIDCCTIFTPKNPSTKPSSKRAEKLEQEFDYLSLIDECIENREVMWIKENDIPNELAEFL